MKIVNIILSAYTILGGINSVAATIKPNDRYKTDYETSWSSDDWIYAVAASASGCTFVKSKTKANSGAILDEISNSTTYARAEKAVTHTEYPSTSSFPFSVSGELGGGSGPGPVLTWSAALQQNFFWLSPKEKIVKAGIDVTVSANGAPTTSTWTINSSQWKNSSNNPVEASSITLGQSLWTAMGWSGSDPPTAGKYIVTATTTEETSRSATATVYAVGFSQASDLWWFNGESPASYSVQTTLTAIGLPPGLWTWSVTKGASLIDLNLGNETGDSITTVNHNSLNIKSTGASSSSGDVEVTLSNGDFEVKYATTVKTPYQLIYNTGTPGTPIVPITDVALNAGFQTTIKYKILDQSGTVMPANVPVNEEFTSQIYPDHVDANWSRANPNGLVVSPNNFWDTITIAPASYMLWLYSPEPVNPGATGHTTPVDHWFGKINVGSATSGNGVTVKTLTWQRYRGRGRHL